MRIRELIGARVELSPATFNLVAPPVDRPLPGGAGRLRADIRRAILSVDGVATFAIEDGMHVWLAPVPSADPGRIAMWLHGSVAAIVLAQRGTFALHASVVQSGGRSIALTGGRGAGKSTTALRLVQRGYALVTDDVSPLVLADRVVVQPFDRPVHVLPQTAADLGLDLSQASRLFDEQPKLTLPAPRLQATPLDGIAALRVEATPRVRHRRVLGATGHWLIAANIYREELFRELWQEEMFKWTAAVAAQVPLYEVTRPAEGWSVDAVADELERIIDSRTAS